MRTTSAIILAALICPGSMPAPTWAAACHDVHDTSMNSSGHVVPDPKCVTGYQAGERAICRDGSHSFSEQRQGTCSRHGGVAQWD